MNSRDTTDSAAAARRARFGTLPERIRREDLVEEKTATVNTPTHHAYDSGERWMSLSCLAVDLGL